MRLAAGGRCGPSFGSHWPPRHVCRISAPRRSRQAPRAGAQFAPATPYVVEGMAALAGEPATAPLPSSVAAAAARLYRAHAGSGGPGDGMLGSPDSLVIGSVGTSGGVSGGSLRAGCLPSPAFLPSPAYAHVHGPGHGHGLTGSPYHHPHASPGMGGGAAGLPLISGVPLPSPVLRPGGDAGVRGRGMAQAEGAKADARVARLIATLRLDS
jgi:hypothetical protein